MNSPFSTCYICQRSDAVRLLGVASIPLPPSDPSVPVNYLDAGLVTLGVLAPPRPGFASSIYSCRRCDLIWRSASLLAPPLVSRLDQLVTVLSAHEEWWATQRTQYFRREFLKLRRLVQPGQHLRVAHLDIGCSYGHLLDISHAAGWQVAGVDASKSLIERLIPRKPYPLVCLVLPQEPLPFPDDSFNLITFYDSFYMLEDPLAVLNDVFDKLIPGGYLVVRLTNRNRYVKLWLLGQRLLRPLRRGCEIDAMAILGDLKYSYSPRSFARLLKRSKFESSSLRIRLLERGKKGVSPVTRVVYAGSLLFSWSLLKQAILTPAFTAVVRKQCA